MEGGASEAIASRQRTWTVRLNSISTQDYVLYQAAKGIFHGTLGATSEELADRDLVGNNTLLLVLSAALIARYGPDVMKIGRNTI